MNRNVRSNENAAKDPFGQNKHLLYIWKKYLQGKIFPDISQY